MDFPWWIHTDRLSIAPLDLRDASFIYTLLNTDDWKNYIGDRHIHDITDARRYISEGPLQHYLSPPLGLHKIILSSDPAKSIGICGFLKRSYLDVIDLGYALLPAYYHHGYMLEATLALCSRVMEDYSPKEIAAIVKDQNLRSIHLLTKIGFRLDDSSELEEPDLLLYKLRAAG